MGTRAMPGERESRIEITRDEDGKPKVILYCEDTKKMMPLVGMAYPTAVVFANLMVRIHEEGMCLPEAVYDSFLTPSS